MPSVHCLSCLSVIWVYCGQAVGWIKMKLGVGVGLGPGHVVLDGDPAPPSPKGHSPQLSTPVCCGQMTGWIKMPLGTDYGGRPWPRWHCVRWGPSSPLKGAQPPLFGPYLLWPNGSMDQDATWYEGRCWPRRHCILIIVLWKINLRDLLFCSDHMPFYHPCYENYSKLPPIVI